MKLLRPSLKPALNPATIAIVGASERPGSRGFHLWNTISRSCGDTPVRPVNPKYKTLGQHRCYARLSEIPGQTDLAVIALRGERVLRALKDAGEASVRSVLITPEESGYANDPVWQKKVLQEIEKYGLRLIGPDSHGFMTPGAGINVSYWAEPARPGNIALISQSGTITGALLDYARDADLGFSGVISTGMSLDVDLPELLDIYSADNNTRVIALYVEGIRHPRLFYSALRTASLRKHVVVLKAPSGQDYAADRIASFQLGTDTGRDEAFAALVDRAGGLLVSSFEEFTGAVTALATNRLPVGNRLALISNSTGFASLAAAQAQTAGVDLHGLSNESIRILQESFPSGQLPVNPVCVGVTAQPERFRKTLQTVLDDPMIDGAVTVMAPSPLLDTEQTLKLLAKTAAGSYKPVITAWISDRITREMRARLKKIPNAGISVMQSPAAAVRCFGYLAGRTARKNARLTPPSDTRPALLPEAVENARALVERVRADGRHTLNPDEVFTFLEAFGLRHVPGRTAYTPQEAVAHANAIGWPVALKVIARGLVHRAAAGGVRLNINSPAELLSAWDNLNAEVSKASPFTPLIGCFVQKMVSRTALRELRLAITHDNVFGPLIEFGASGHTGTIYQDTACELPPFSYDRALALIGTPLVSHALGRYRGLSPNDRSQLADALCRLSVVSCLIPAVRDIVLKPLAWTEEGPAAIDARVNLTDAPVRPTALFSHMTICPPAIEGVQTWDAPKGLMRLRPLYRSDFSKLREFIAGLSDKTFYLRFHCAQRLPAERIIELCNVDQMRENAWVVEHEHTLIATGRWHLTDIPGEAEFGVVVADAWHRNGIARRLMKNLEDTARLRGITRLVGFVLKGNEAMHGMMRALGYICEPSDSRDTDTWVKKL